MSAFHPKVSVQSNPPMWWLAGTYWLKLFSGMMSRMGITSVPWSLANASCSNSGSIHCLLTTQWGSMNTITGLLIKAAPITLDRISPCRFSFLCTCTLGCIAFSSSWNCHSGALPSSTNKIWSTISMGLCASIDPTVALIWAQVSFRYGMTSETRGRSRVWNSRRQDSCRTSRGVGNVGSVPVNSIAAAVDSAGAAALAMGGAVGLSEWPRSCGAGARSSAARAPPAACPTGPPPWTIFLSRA
mmetsp:Transcript_71274/g.170255  ORF Transcript_71274/g.170255 Transcript_71274/m.170255 type:complete len:243 (+) Transcript_71274:497-1225(+)